MLLWISALRVNCVLRARIDMVLYLRVDLVVGFEPHAQPVRIRCYHPSRHFVFCLQSSMDWGRREVVRVD
jgi:hypothetical protein